uniref:Apple domain-containing protein n=1 Tax=Fagus sylvatica TaxID=28930 RepID=A0A2N9G696_FAGSY
MKLGLNRITGLDRFLTSWKSQDDPGTGDYLYKMNPSGLSTSLLYKAFDPVLAVRSMAMASIISSNNLIWIAPATTWNDGDLQWKEHWSAPNYRCDNYGQCGVCEEAVGMSMCGNGEGFVKVEHLKGPDTSNATWMDMSMSSSECEQACLSNCSCTAFTSINIDGKGTGCLVCYLHKEVQRFSWQKEAAGYYYIICCCAIVSGILDSLYVAKEEEETKGSIIEWTTYSCKKAIQEFGTGIEEFKNEVMLIAKLQHRNLVKILAVAFRRKKRC